MNRRALEIRAVDRSLEASLQVFFEEVRESGDDSLFHPHPFTTHEAERIAAYSGKDLYYVMVDGHVVLGYGMLRGWDAGFDVPSLGIYIRSLDRKEGLGRLFMHFLHSAARRKGADRIRLKVYPDNEPARRMYESLGYRFDASEEEQLVGVLELMPAVRDA